MALIKCPECNKEISDKVSSCPNCGYPIAAEAKREKKKSSKKKPIPIFLFLGIVAAVAIFLMFNHNQNKLKREEANALFIDATETITRVGGHAYETCSIVLQVWSTANQNLWDFNRVFSYMYSGDIRGHEWSGLGMDEVGFSPISWGEVSFDMNHFAEDRLKRLNRGKQEVDEKLEQIKQIDHNEFGKEVDAIVDYYNSYLKLYNAAVNPSGNQIQYSANLTTMNDDFNQNKVELEVLIKE